MQQWSRDVGHGLRTYATTSASTSTARCCHLPLKKSRTSLWIRIGRMKSKRKNTRSRTDNSSEIVEECYAGGGGSSWAGGRPAAEAARRSCCCDSGRRSLPSPASCGAHAGAGRLLRVWCVRRSCGRSRSGHRERGGGNQRGQREREGRNSPEIAAGAPPSWLAAARRGRRRSGGRAPGRARAATACVRRVLAVGG